MAFFFLWYLFFVPEIFEFSCYANLVTDDVIGCASTVVRHKIRNISANSEAMLLKLGRDVAPCEIYQMVHILMLLWQHGRFQSPAPSKWNITICNLTRQNTWSYLRRMPVPPSLGLLFNIFNCIFGSVQLEMVMIDFKEEETGTEYVAIATSKYVRSGIFEWMNECVFIYRTYHILPQGGLQFKLSEIERCCYLFIYLISLTHPTHAWNIKETTDRLPHQELRPLLFSTSVWVL